MHLTAILSLLEVLAARATSKCSHSAEIGCVSDSRPRGGSGRAHPGPPAPSFCRACANLFRFPKVFVSCSSGSVHSCTVPLFTSLAPSCWGPSVPDGLLGGTSDMGSADTTGRSRFGRGGLGLLLGRPMNPSPIAHAKGGGSWRGSLGVVPEWGPGATGPKAGQVLANRSRPPLRHHLLRSRRPCSTLAGLSGSRPEGIRVMRAPGTRAHSGPGCSRDPAGNCGSKEPTRARSASKPNQAGSALPAPRSWPLTGI